MQLRNWLRRLPLVAVVVILSLAVGLTTARAQVTPPTVNATLAPGQSLTVTKNVGTPFVPPQADFYFLSDTTGSMGPTIAAVKANANAIMTLLSAGGTNSAFGAGDYKDFPFDAYAFNPCSAVQTGAAGQAAALACINAWVAGGGADIAEGQFFALHQMAAHAAAGYRAAATKFVIWFGDAPAHDPVCNAINGADPHDTDEASLTAELVAAGIKVIAISVDSGPGLNADPTANDGDYTPPCATEGGTAGQATRLAAATGGSVQTGVPPDQVAAAILRVVLAVQVTVTPQATCAPQLSVTFNPTSQTVTSGSTATFSETITVSNAALPGVYTCTVQFLINGQPATPPLTQTIRITVLNTPCRVKANGQTLDGTRALDALVQFIPGFRPNPIGAVVHGDRTNMAGNLSSGNITGLTCVGGSIANIGGVGITTAGFVNYVLRLEERPGPTFFYRIAWPGYTSSGDMLGTLIIQQ